jgi:hypothetical protein
LSSHKRGGESTGIPLDPLVFGWTAYLNIQNLEPKLNVKIFENLKPKDRRNELFYLKTMHVQKVLTYLEKNVKKLLFS